MQLNLITGVILQYYVLSDLFYAGVHTSCAPVKDIAILDMYI